MKRLMTLTFILILTCLTNSHAAGHAYDENFSVLTSTDNSHAEYVLSLANWYRIELSHEWTTGYRHRRTSINYVEGTENKAMTWQGTRGLQHAIYLNCTKQQLPDLLKHEVCHAVLYSRYPDIPEWVNEGIACRYDDKERVEYRKRSLPPDPEYGRLMAKKSFRSSDIADYAVSGYMVDVLLMHGKEKFLRYLDSPSLRQVYGVDRFEALVK